MGCPGRCVEASDVEILERLAVIAMLVVSLAAKPRMARAECDPAMHIEPLASRFEIQSNTVYDKNTNLTWMRCSYGQEWAEAEGCRGSVGPFDWDSAMGFHWQGDARGLAASAARRTAKHRGDRLQEAGRQRNRVSRDPVDPVLDEHRDRPVLCSGGVSSGPEWRRGTFSDHTIRGALGANRSVADQLPLSHPYSYQSPIGSPFFPSGRKATGSRHPFQRLEHELQVLRT